MHDLIDLPDIEEVSARVHEAGCNGLSKPK